ncbi:MAG: hypothetical protein WCF91_02575 [bacterium]|jgi:hypothetical protein
MKQKPRKQQEDRLLKQLSFQERKKQEQIRKQIILEATFLAV